MAIRLLTIAAFCLLASVQSNAALIIAESDGSLPFTRTMYTNGFGSVGDANYVDRSVIDALNPLGDSVIIKLTIGVWTDFYKPVSGENVGSMLTAGNSDDKHLWSSSEAGTFVAPSYWDSSGNPHLGGSANGYAPEPQRNYLGFWGSEIRDGACCSLTSSGTAAWGRAFVLESVTALPDTGGPDGSVPAPATLALLGLGFAGLGLSRRNK